jgi:hypothetical protein
MTPRRRVAGLSKLPRRARKPHKASADSARSRAHNSSDSGTCAQGAAAGTRALVVLVLTPALIFFMSRKDVGHAASRPATAIAQAAAGKIEPHYGFERWPSSGFADMYRAEHPRWRAASLRYDARSTNLVYARAMLFARKYDSRPYWKYRKLQAGAPTDRATADLAIEHLIPCESMGRTINRIDSNGKMSYGILQFQDWDEWEAASGMTGNPDNRRDAIRMAEWAIQNGMVNHWTCASILKME